VRNIWGYLFLLGSQGEEPLSNIKQKIWMRIQGWQENLLSKFGKEILVKAVAQAIPTYAIPCIDLIKTFCHDWEVLVELSR
jgi:hypothetical protein